DRFFLEDLINTMNDLFRYPACLSEKYPCDRIKTDSCEGYCLKPRKELLELFIRSYLRINPELNRQISERITQKNNELEFTGAEYLKRQSEILIFFYRTIKFLHVAKNLSGEFILPQGKINLENGLISSYWNTNGKTIDFPVYQIEYQEKEYLAVNKEHLDEMWIVYHYLEKTQKKLFSRIYLKSVKEFINRMKDYEEF
ncbi:MAG: hypothetical protein JW996_01635, partial [Candidatus Cloacimonetes bacterium]|nr:hypothetical protein [Candidatus Cloacimonadota bacterium]